MYMSLLHTPSIPGPNLPRRSKIPLKSSPLGYNKQYYSWELVCYSVKDSVYAQGPSLRRKTKVHQCVLFFMNEKKEKKKSPEDRPERASPSCGREQSRPQPL